MKPFDVMSGSATHTGMVRRNNEDSILLLEFSIIHDDENGFLGFYAVADGLGGHEYGEVASRMATQSLRGSFMGLLLPQYPLFKNPDFMKNVIKQSLGDVILKANEEVFLNAQAKGNTMGTTLAAALVIQGMAYIANVGDSRVYLLHNGKLQSITRDHSFVANLAATGKIALDDIYTHPNRNIITRYVGMEAEIVVDLYEQKLEPGDYLLLCSDGLWEMVRDDEMKKIMLNAVDPRITCNKLIEAANLNGGVDNISGIVVKVLSDSVTV